MKTTIKDNVLHIEIPLHAPRPSATGKTLTVASSNGNKETEATINGKPVIVGINAYIKPYLNPTPRSPTGFRGVPFFARARQTRPHEESGEILAGGSGHECLNRLPKFISD